jgi:AraC family transcriptional regulator
MSMLSQDGRFFGRVRRLRTLGDLVFCETAYQPGAFVPWHSHESPLVCLVLGGALDEHGRGGRRVTFEGGKLFFHPAHEPHAHRFGARTRCFSVTLGPTLLRRLERAGSGPLPGPVDLDATRAAWLARQLYTEFERGSDASELTLEGLVLAIVGELTRRPGPARVRRPGWVSTVRDLVETRFRESVGLADVADAVGVHPVHGARTFRREFGCSVGAYVRRRRIEYACRTLVRTEDSLASIALASGFADQSHFSRRFKELIGLTPSAFRAARSTRSPHARPD